MLNSFDYHILEKCYFTGHPVGAKAPMVKKSIRKLHLAKLVKRVKFETTNGCFGKPCPECTQIDKRKKWIATSYVTTAKGQAWYLAINKDFMKRVLKISCPKPPYPPGDFDDSKEDTRLVSAVKKLLKEKKLHWDKLSEKKKHDIIEEAEENND